MRTLIFLCCTVLFSLTPKHLCSQNDRIHIDTNKVISVDEVFKVIKAQTDYSFVYHENLFNAFPKVQLKKGVIRLYDLLNQCFSASDISVIFSSNNTILIKELTNKSKDQGHSVSGTVTDQKGLPLPGVTILIKGASKGSTTDINGKFAFIVPDPANVLVFSSLGFETQEIIAGNKTVIHVTLKESVSELDQVTISARYYNASQREETGSVSRINSKAIEKQPINNPIAAMTGHISGVIINSSGQPGGGLRVQIRGQNFIDINKGGAFGLTNAPFYIVDGVPYESGTLENSGEQAGLSIGQVSPLNAISPTDIESIEVLKDADATAIYGSRGANGVIVITTKKGKAGKTQVKFNINSSLSEVARFMDLINTQQYLEVRKEAVLNDGYTLESILNDHPTFDTGSPDLYAWDQERYTDWQEVLTGGTAYRHNAQLTFSGGNQSTQFLLSGTYNAETTVFPGDSKYERLATHTNINHQSKDKRFRLNVSVNYSSDTNNLPGTSFFNLARTLAPNAPALYDAQGNLNWENSTWQNPLAVLETEYQALTKGFIANTTLSYKLMPSLEFKTSIGYNDYRLESYNTIPSSSFDPAEFGILSNNQTPSTFSKIYRNYGVRNSWIIEPQINWQRYWDDICIKVLLGGTFQQNKTQRLRLYGRGFPSDALIHDIALAETQNFSLDEESDYKYQGFFGRVNFNWQDKYILNLTARRDGSSRFGPGKQFGVFGAAGVAWLFSNENILEDNTILSFGKLRASYGTAGNDSSPNYAFYDSYTDSGRYNGQGLAPMRLFNSDFSWEEIKKLEVALELGFWQDRIFLITAWYHNRSSNQLVDIPLPITTGFSGINGNLPATVQNTGIEIDLSTKNIIKDAFSWSTTFNIAANRNKLLAFSGLEGSTYANQLVIGEPLGIKQLYHSIGVDPETGIYQFKDYNNDGIINIEDRQILVDFTPKYFGGFGNIIQYKNLKLDVFFQFVKQISTANNDISGSFGTGGHPDGLNRWQQPGDETPFQRYTVGRSSLPVREAATRYSGSDANIADGSFIRLRNASLSYAVPKKVIKGLFDLNIYLHGQNLFIMTAFKRGDPGGGATFRQVTLGLNIGF